MNLTHILWIGGATDTGKSTIARQLGETYALPVYHYDEYDLTHHQELAQTDPKIEAYLQASLEENWVQQTPETLRERTLNSFNYRFPLVVRDLEALRAEKWIIAEGFGFTPELIMPYLADKQQAIWLIPSLEFKIAAVERRNKPSFRFKTSDPDRAKSNLVNRDLLLAQYYEEETAKYDGRCVVVDETKSIEDMVALVKSHFAPFLS